MDLTWKVYQIRGPDNLAENWRMQNIHGSTGRRLNSDKLSYFFQNTKSYSRNAIRCALMGSSRVERPSCELSGSEVQE